MSLSDGTSPVGQNTTLTDAERKLLVKLFSNPLDIPQGWFGWLKAKLEVDPPNLQQKDIGGITAINPWTVNINPLVAVTSTNFGTLTVDTGALMNGHRDSTGAQNATVGWDVVLDAGTWDFVMIHKTGTDRGKYAVALDGSAVGVIDGYAGSGAANTVDTISSIRRPVPTKTRLSLTMSTKNASSSSYVGAVQLLTFLRRS